MLTEPNARRTVGCKSEFKTVPGLDDRATRALDLVLMASGSTPVRALIAGPVADRLPSDEAGAQAESNTSPGVSAEGKPQVEIGWRDPRREWSWMSDKSPPAMGRRAAARFSVPRSTSG